LNSSGQAYLGFSQTSSAVAHAARFCYARGIRWTL